MYNEIFKGIDSLENEYVAFLDKVCNIESPTSNKAGVDEVGRCFIEEAKRLGFEIEVLPQEVAGDAICITMNPDAEREPICVSGHIDTVHPVGLFGYPPVTRDDEKTYGPGVMDCKGGVVAALMAMEALAKCGFKSRPVRLLIQSDEETGSSTSGKATINYICEKAKGSVAFLNLEGQTGNTAVIKRKGILRYKFEITGRAAHSSICYTGANAVCEAAHKIIKLEALKDPDGLTCNCGVISGGTTPNSVADKCTFSADIRFSTREEMEKGIKLLEEVAATSEIEGCTCTLQRISLRPAMPLCDRNIDLLKKMNEIYAECGLPILEGKSTMSGSDAAYVTECGIPCVDSIGTAGGRIHSKEEFIYTKSLAEAAKRIAAVIYGI